MSKHLVSLLFLGLAVIAFTAQAGPAQTIEVRVAASADDAEQHLTAGMDVGSTDLELPYEDGGSPGTDEQLICLRFVVPIPKGVMVSNAWVEFNCDETKGGSNPVNLIIEGQLAADPPAFTSATNNLTGRAPWTKAQVAWSVENWTAENQKSKTPNIAAVIQEIVNLPDWTSNSALVLAFRDDKNNPSTGIRCADAYDDDPAVAALLHIEISKAPASAPNPANGVTDVAWGTVLSWTAGENATAHDVYFGTAYADVNNGSQANPMGVLVSQGQTDTQYDPAGLDYGQTYYWRVDEIGANETVKGGVWSFAVEPFAYPITNITATASSAQPDMGPENAIDGSGLNANDQHSTELTDMWTSDGSQPNWIQFEFDKVYKLNKLLVWNSNQLIETILGFGAKDVTIEYSVDGATWTVLESVPEFAKATSSPNYAANTTVDLAGVMAKFVKLTINSNWGGMAPQTGLAEVRFYYVPVRARLPQPADGATGVSIDTELTWRLGREAESHEVYLGTDPAAMTLADTVTDASYSPSALGLATTYYWKINEIGGAGPYEGEVWSFTTSDNLVVDDFESYTDDAGGEIYNAWADGYEDPKNGSQVGHLMSPFAETTIVHGGRQSMPLFYSNTNGATFSEGTRTFDAPQDWTRAGFTTLTLWFQGAADNTGQVYVKINGTKVSYSGAAGSLAVAGWQPWNIDLTTVSTNLKSVKSLAVGVEGNGASGVLYFDDIALYAAAPARITEWRVNASTDDREEYANGGAMSAADSSDLELGHEGAASATTLQVVGCRWVSIPIPAGATITEAWVQFSADAVGSSYHNEPVSVIIEGQLSPNPVTFGGTGGEISSRPKTTAKVVWDIPVWTQTHLMGPGERTPDISAIIKEIISQPGWAGEAIVLTFRDNPANPSQGCREAEAFDGEADEAPLLHISYQ